MVSEEEVCKEKGDEKKNNIERAKQKERMKEQSVIERERIFYLIIDFVLFNTTYNALLRTFKQS